MFKEGTQLTRESKKNYSISRYQENHQEGNKDTVNIKETKIVSCNLHLFNRNLRRKNREHDCISEDYNIENGAVLEEIITFSKREDIHEGINTQY